MFNIFLGAKFKSLKADGSVNASGTAEFFEIGGAFSTYKSTYTTSALTVANSNTITLDAAGEAAVYLNGDYDVRIKDSAGVTLTTALGINPAASTSNATDNLALNPSFEDDTNSDNIPDNWTVTTYSGGTATKDTTDRSHGTNSMKFVTAGNGGGTLTSTSYFPVMAGGVLSWSFALKSTANVRNLVQILWYDASQVALGSPTTDLYDNSTTNPTSWTNELGSVAVPATAYFAKFKFFGAHSSNGNAGTVRLDDLVIRDTSTLVEGPDIASASTTNVFDGFFAKHVTGTVTITSFGTAAYAGQRARVVFDGILTLTQSANLNLPGGANIVTAADDVAYLYADTTTQIDVEYIRASGLTVVAPASDVQTFTNTGANTWTKPAGFATGSRVLIQLWGAGGSGGRDTDGTAGGGGGGSYKAFWKILSELGATETATVGAGGAARTTTGIGNNGGSSTFGTYGTGYGGTGGGQNTSGGAGGGWASTAAAGTAANDVPTTEGTGGSATVAGIAGYYTGGGGGATTGAAGTNVGANSVYGGAGGGGKGAASGAAAGGTSEFGGNGGANSTSGASTAGSVPGGGGGSNGSSFDSGAGGNGKIIVSVFK